MMLKVNSHFAGCLPISPNLRVGVMVWIRVGIKVRVRVMVGVEVRIRVLGLWQGWGLGWVWG